MAQTGSAQREPSMEEILASIRRIIEDSDAVRAPGEDEVHGEIAAPVTPPVELRPAEQNEVAAFRAGLDEPVADDHPSEPELAEVAPAVREPGFVAPPSAEIHPLRGETRPLEPVAHASPLDGDIVGDEPVAVPGTEPSPVDISAADESRPSIISAQTGRQVAAAFGELSEAFAASRKRSFDEMAEDMLRPMLQDWLDNNLPTLVERLVREEIERVARGG